VRGDLDDEVGVEKMQFLVYLRAGVIDRVARARPSAQRL